MNRFEVVKPVTLAQAKDAVQEKAWSQYKAGGIDVIDHLKEHLEEPPRLVDLKGIPGLADIKVEADGSLRIGALASSLLVERPGLDAVPTLAAVREREMDLRSRT